MPVAMPSAVSDVPRAPPVRAVLQVMPLAIMRLLIFILLGVLVALQYRLWVGAGSQAELHALRQEIVQRKAELERLRNRNLQLQAEVEDLRNGEAALEERARDELGMIKAGEAFIQVIEHGKEPDPPAPPDTEPGTPQARHKKR
jgi:cell division protein FtsB